MGLTRNLLRHLVLFAYAMTVWLGLVVLEVVLGFDGIVAGLCYWASLILLFLGIWYANIPIVRQVNNEYLRFGASLGLTTLIITIFIITGIIIGAIFKRFISN